MTIKPRLRSGIFFGIVMTIFFVIQDLVTKDINSAYEAVRMIVSGLVGGTVAGALFGWLSGFLTNSRLFTVKSDLLLNPEEKVIYETPANHYREVEAVGGILLLTNERLVFKSHRINIQNHQLSIDLTAVTEINRFKTLALVNNGVSITTNSGITEKFVVSNADEWIRRLSVRDGLQHGFGASRA